MIADAVYHALKGGTRIADVFDMVSAIAGTGTAAVVMTYWNPVDRYGAEQITRLCRGFVYAVSLMGITGTKDAVSSLRRWQSYRAPTRRLGARQAGACFTGAARSGRR